MSIRVRRHLEIDKPLIEYLDSRLFAESERVERIEESAWWIGGTKKEPRLRTQGLASCPQPSPYSYRVRACSRKLAATDSNAE